MKRSICLLGLFFLLAAILFPVTQAEARIGGRVRVTLAASSGYDWVYIYVKGRNMGRLRRGQTRQFVVRDVGLSRRPRVEIRAVRDRYRKSKYVVSRIGRVARVVFSPPAQKGKLSVKLSNTSGYRSADIYINGRNRGRVRRGQRREFSLNSGRYTVGLRRDDVVKQRRVNITAGRKTYLSIRLERRERYGRLRVRYARRSGPRWARLSIDGRDKGRIRRGRTRTFRIKVGRHTVRMERGTLSKQRSVEVRENRRTYVSIRLKRRVRYGRLEVRYARRSGPRWARLSIDGRDKGRIRRGRTRTFRIKVGRHTVRMERGVLSKQRSVEVRENRRTYVSIRLKRRVRRGRLEISYKGRYRWANLSIDGRDRGRIYRNRNRTFRIKVGRHTVRVERNGRSATKSARVYKNDTTRVRLAIRRRRGTIRVSLGNRSSVSWVVLYINGVRKARISRGDVKRYRYRAGSYRIRLERAGTVSYRRTVRVTPRRIVSVDVRL